MGIVVYWLETDGRAACEHFGSDALRPALQRCEALRRAGHRHVSLSSELEDRVGAPGVDAVEAGRLPSGAAYTFTKAHRGAGPVRPADAPAPPVPAGLPPPPEG